MGSRTTGYKILMGVLLATPLGARATEAPKPLAPLNIEAKYMVAWNGITIGRIYLTSREDAKSYSLTVDTKTHGIATVFSNERRVASADGLVRGGHYIPQHYASLPQDKDEGRRTTLTYDAAGKIIKRTRVPDDDPTWRTPVPQNLLAGTTDPVTAGFILRRRLHDALSHKQSDAGVKSYDGARLADIKFTALKADARVEVMGAYKEAIDTVVVREPIAGYTPKEIKIFTKGDPIVNLYFSDDEKFLPIRATVSTTFGELSATLTEAK